MVVAAKESFVTAGKRRVVAGELFDDEHELVRAAPHLFEPFENVVRGAETVEAATAAPGEKRSTVRRTVEPKPEEGDGGD